MTLHIHSILVSIACSNRLSCNILACAVRLSSDQHSFARMLNQGSSSYSLQSSLAMNIS